MAAFKLPPQIAEGADLAGNEYGWQVSSFPNALVRAQALGYACIGGQFQFRHDTGIYEMYWLSADSTSRGRDRIMAVILPTFLFRGKTGFEKLVSETDFRNQALGWPAV